MATDEIIRPQDLVLNHCRNQKCAWCVERCRRARERSIADSIAAAKPSTTFDYWNRKTTTGYTQFGPYPGATTRHWEDAPPLAIGGPR